MTTDQKMLKRIQGLLDKANGTTNEHEKEAFYNKAEELMRKHSVELFMLDAANDDRKGREPIVKHVDLPLVRGDWEFNDNLARLFAELCQHFGVRVAPFSAQKESLKRLVVGWEHDIAFLEVLFTSLFVDIMANMKPKWDPEAPEGENLHKFKSTGYKWEDIWYIRCEALDLHEPWERKHGVRWTNVYKKWADATGTDRQMSSSLRYFRLDFGYGYVQEVSTRLRTMRDSRNEGPEVGLVLADRKSDLDKFFEELYPPPPQKPVDPNAPKPKPVKYKTRNLNSGAYRAGRSQGRRADLGQTRIN